MTNDGLAKNKTKVPVRLGLTVICAGGFMDAYSYLLHGQVFATGQTGNIVLLTDNETTGAQLVEALPGIIDGLKEEGYTLVTLSDLIATDEDLVGEVNLARVSMPEDAVLPTVPADDEGSSA